MKSGYEGKDSMREKAQRLFSNAVEGVDMGIKMSASAPSKTPMRKYAKGGEVKKATGGEMRAMKNARSPAFGDKYGVVKKSCGGPSAAALSHTKGWGNPKGKAVGGRMTRPQHSTSPMFEAKVSAGRANNPDPTRPRNMMATARIDERDAKSLKEPLRKVRSQVSEGIEKGCHAVPRNKVGRFAVGGAVDAVKAIAKRPYHPGPQPLRKPPQITGCSLAPKIARPSQAPSTIEAGELTDLHMPKRMTSGTMKKGGVVKKAAGGKVEGCYLKRPEIADVPQKPKKPTIAGVDPIPSHLAKRGGAVGQRTSSKSKFGENLDVGSIKQISTPMKAKHPKAASNGSKNSGLNVESVRGMEKMNGMRKGGKCKK